MNVFGLIEQLKSAILHFIDGWAKSFFMSSLLVIPS